MGLFEQKAAKFVQNEIFSRCKILGVKTKDFPIPPEVLGGLLKLEIEEKITRKNLRFLIDDICGIKDRKKVQ